VNAVNKITENCRGSWISRVRRTLCATEGLLVKILLNNESKGKGKGRAGYIAWSGWRVSWSYVVRQASSPESLLSYW